MSKWLRLSAAVLETEEGWREVGERGFGEEVSSFVDSVANVVSVEVSLGVVSGWFPTMRWANDWNMILQRRCLDIENNTSE